MNKSRVIRRGDWVIIKIVENGSHLVIFEGKAQMSDGRAMSNLMAAARDKGFEWEIPDRWWE